MPLTERVGDRRPLRRSSRRPVLGATFGLAAIMGLTVGTDAADVSAANATSPVIVAAGDIACANNTLSSSCQQANTARLIKRINPTRVMPLGDLVYGTERTAAQFQASYGPFSNPAVNPSWGDFKSISSPTLGNHDYGDVYATADGYFAYWNGSATGNGPAGPSTKAYYAETIGTWRVIHANSRRLYQAGGAQDRWIKAELADNADRCVMVTWHDPRYSSGSHGDASHLTSLFATLYNGAADVLLTGHDHAYERFAPQGPKSNLDNGLGIRQFVVGTGGKSAGGFSSVKPNSEVRIAKTYGVLKVTLNPGSYDWAFIDINDRVLDSGTQNCH